MHNHDLHDDPAFKADPLKLVIKKFMGTAKLLAERGDENGVSSFIFGFTDDFRRMVAIPLTMNDERIRYEIGAAMAAFVVHDVKRYLIVGEAVARTVKASEVPLGGIDMDELRAEAQPVISVCGFERGRTIEAHAFLTRSGNKVEVGPVEWTSEDEGSILFANDPLLGKLLPPSGDPPDDIREDMEKLLRITSKMFGIDVAVTTDLTLDDVTVVFGDATATVCKGRVH